jgi:AraC-like DNA-binding protein
MGYTERPLEHPAIACVWSNGSTGGRVQRVVPDGCTDLMWMPGGGLLVAGPDTRSHLSSLAPGTRIVGVRLRPGAAGAWGVPADALRDARVPAEALWGDAARRLAERLAALEADAHDAEAALLAAVLARRPARDPLVVAATAALARPHTRVTSLAAALGISERALRRRFHATVGYGPKTLARVLRFQRLLALPEAPLAERALDAGFADQAHMTAEVTRLAGVPPLRLLADRAPLAA